MGQFYRVGLIVATQGLQGEVRVKVFTDFPNERFKKGAVLALFETDLDKFVQNVVVEHARQNKQLWIVKFEEFDSIAAVEQFRNFTLKVAAKSLSNLTEGEYYYHEIIGLEVFEKTGQKIGHITEILQPGANDVWVVKREGQADLLLPYISSVILSVDLAQKRVFVDVPEGLD